MTKKDVIISTVLLILFNLFIIALLNNPETPHISPKFASWWTGFYTGAFVMKMTKDYRR